MLAPVTEIFVDVDDFCKAFEASQTKKRLPIPQKKLIRPCCMSTSEIMTIMILFQMSYYRNFKQFYLQCIQPNKEGYWKKGTGPGHLTACNLGKNRG